MKNRLPKSFLLSLGEEDDRPDGNDKLNELRRRTIERPAICEDGCMEVFDRTKGVRHDLPNSPLFCSTLCAYRHKKKKLALAGVMMK